ncbi:MAG: helix-turn-helix transcriptional regulator [Ruminococcus sp.]|jgi:transcriptional regulator with XRE-family HTH domain|nr:helix-turn-helix transcriptional regulator [Ruminococcus sp.]
MANTPVTPKIRKKRMLRAAREAKGLTQEKMAKKLGCCKSNYSLIENDIDKVSFGRVYELCRILSIDIKELAEIGR